jgi:hypothetical protein
MYDIFINIFFACLVIYLGFIILSPFLHLFCIGVEIVHNCMVYPCYGCYKRSRCNGLCDKALKLNNTHKFNRILGDERCPYCYAKLGIMSGALAFKQLRHQYYCPVCDRSFGSDWDDIVSIYYEYYIDYSTYDLFLNHKNESYSRHYRSHQELIQKGDVDIMG